MEQMRGYYMTIPLQSGMVYAGVVGVCFVLTMLGFIKKGKSKDILPVYSEKKLSKQEYEYEVEKYPLHWREGVRLINVKCEDEKVIKNSKNKTQEETFCSTTTIVKKENLSERQFQAYKWLKKRVGRLEQYSINELLYNYNILYNQNETYNPITPLMEKKCTIMKKIRNSEFFCSK